MWRCCPSKLFSQFSTQETDLRCRQRWSQSRALIALADVPVAAPSANRSGRPSPTTAQHVVADYQRQTLSRPVTVIDGGACDVGVESTVVDAITESGVVRVLRPGGIGPDQLKAALERAGHFDWTVRVFGQDWSDDSLKAQPPTPGMKYRHYAPDATVVLLEIVDDAGAPSLLELNAGRKAALLAPEPSSLSGARIGTRHSLGSTPAEHAQRLFAGLRELDSADVEVIFIERPSGSEWNEGIGLAVGERAGKAGSGAALVRVRAERS